MIRIFHLLVCSPDTNNSLGCILVYLGTQHSVWCSQVGVRDPSTWVNVHKIPGCVLAGRWNWKQQLRLESSNSNIDDSVPNGILTLAPNTHMTVLDIFHLWNLCIIFIVYHICIIKLSMIIRTHEYDEISFQGLQCTMQLEGPWICN